MQEIGALHAYGHGYKRIDYEYDLISGKVHAVLYQKDSTDQFTHRYYYDEDNRLQRVETSLAGTSPLDFFYEQDAAYKYYLHGPLARSETGHRKVQGMDYAYTLQGWIKGLNSSALIESRDMGKDGTTGSLSSQATARDAYGYTIGYFDGDYSPIGGSSENFELDYSGSGFAGASPSLYNGNIRHIMQHNRQLGDAWGQAYRYDQLHRLKRMESWDNIDSGNYEWQAGGSALAGYKVDSINYDANGNILNLLRRGSTSTYMDYLTYAYNNGTNQLNQVFDQVLSGSFPDDLDNQSMDNYEYDGAGNLTDDAQADAAISWTPYGKVKEVQRSSANQTVQYGYDAQQNRVLKKIVDTSTDGEVWTCYIRDAQGNVLATYTREADTITWSEQHLYGSSRIGILEPGVKWYTGSGTPDTPYFLDTAQLCIGWKRYEVTNHLGNVMAVLSDRKSYHDTDTDGDADYFDPVFLSATDYYPFGFEMPGRKYNFGGYRYGFNGKENDTDGEFSSLTHYDYGFRIYNPAIGRFLSVDPLTRDYPELTPYQFASNSPIESVDLDGLESLNYRWKYYFEQAFGYNFQELQTNEETSKRFAKDLLKVAPNSFNETFNSLDPSQAQSPLDLFFRVSAGAAIEELYVAPVLPTVVVGASKVVKPNSSNSFWSFKWANPKNWFKTRRKSIDEIEDAIKVENLSAYSGGSNKYKFIGSTKIPTKKRVVYLRLEGGVPYIGKTKNTFKARYSNDAQIREAGPLTYLQNIPLEESEFKMGRVSLLSDIENAIIKRNEGPGGILANKEYSDWGASYGRTLDESIDAGIRWLNKNVEGWRDQFDARKYFKE